MKKSLLVLFIIFSPFVTAKFEKLMEHEEGTLFVNSDEGIHITEREHTIDLPIPISKKNLKGIAETRFHILKKLDVGFHDFKIEKIYRKAVVLNNVKSYVWKGSYKDKKGKTRFFVEFITAKHTYNVFTDNKYSVRKARKYLSEVI